jgi:predicted lipid carrier protein YhbT
MASVEECDEALHRVAARLAAVDGQTRKRAALDRTMTCTLRDLGVTFAGQLRDGELLDIQQVEQNPPAKVRMTMTSDDLIALVDGTLNMGTAFATGRVKIDASVLDLMKLRSIF